MLYEAECLQLAWKFIEKNKYHAQHDQAILAMLIDFGSFRCSWPAFLCIHFFSTDVWTNSPPFVRTEEWCKTVYPGSRATMSGSSCARLERDGLSPNQFNIQPFMGLVSLNTALSGPYFLGGWHFWDPLRFPWFNLMKGHIFLAPFKSSNVAEGFLPRILGLIPAGCGWCVGEGVDGMGVFGRRTSGYRKDNACQN